MSRDRRNTRAARKQSVTQAYRLVLGFAAVTTYVVAVALCSALLSGQRELWQDAAAVAATAAHTNQQPSWLNGEWVDRDRANVRPVAVMIDNHPNAYPLFGLAQASVVYEAPAEGGLSRFMALFAITADHPDAIGPVRSARPYFIDWAGEWGALYAHSGGSPAALQQLKTDTAVIDINEFSLGKYFWRDTHRRAPHNLFTSLASLDRYRVSVAVSPTVDRAPRPFIDGRSNDIPKPAMIRFAYTAAAESAVVEWRYQRHTNTYVRFADGAPVRDSSDQQVTASVVVVQFVKMRVIDDVGRKDITTTGSGRVAVFQNGTVIEGQWQNKHGDSHTVFADSVGTEIPLVRGHIWIEIIPVGTNVSWE